MLQCYCNSNCFYYLKHETEKEGGNIKYYQINSCNKIYSENTTKKIKCDFYSKIECKEELYISPDNSIQVKIIKQNKINYKTEVNKLLRQYDKLSLNSMAMLNKYLQHFSFDIHVPDEETYDELIMRIKNRKYKKQNKLYIYKGIELNDLRCVGEHKNNNINHNNIDISWRNDPDILSIIPKVVQPKKKFKKIKKLTKINVENFDIEYEFKDCEEKIKKSSEDGSNSNSDSESETEKESEVFDVEDDLSQADENSYHEFSD